MSTIRLCRDEYGYTTTLLTAADAEAAADVHELTPGSRVIIAAPRKEER